MDKLAKSKLMKRLGKALARTLRSAKKGGAEALYGKKPSRAASVTGMTAAGGSLGSAGEILTGRKDLKRVGSILGGVVGAAHGARRAAAYEARKTKINQGLMGAGLAGLGAMALRSSKSRGD